MSTISMCACTAMLPCSLARHGSAAAMMDRSSKVTTATPMSTPVGKENGVSYTSRSHRCPTSSLVPTCRLVSTAVAEQPCRVVLDRGGGAQLYPRRLQARRPAFDKGRIEDPLFRRLLFAA